MPRTLLVLHLEHLSHPDRGHRGRRTGVEINGRMMGSVGPQVYQALSDRDAFELLLRVYLAEDVEVDQDDLHGSATVVLIGAKNEGVVPENFMQDELDTLLHRYGISFCTLKLTPGMPLRRFESNLSALGHVIVHGANPHSSALKGDEFLRELEALLGVALAKYIEETSKAPAPALSTSWSPASGAFSAAVARG